jgi:hypothetical protein
MRWAAHEGDYGLDVPVGTGATPLEAVEDLLPKLRKLETQPRNWKAEEKA